MEEKKRKGESMELRDGGVERIRVGECIHKGNKEGER